MKTFSVLIRPLIVVLFSTVVLVVDTVHSYVQVA
jgi:hypothetical protein